MTVLDSSTRHLYNKVAKPDDKKNITYPLMNEFKNKTTENSRYETLIKILKGKFWNGEENANLSKIDSELKEFSRYFDCERYPWYSNFKELRNDTTHNVLEDIRQKIETIENPEEIAIKATFYAGCVYRFIKTIPVQDAPKTDEIDDSSPISKEESKETTQKPSKGKYFLTW